MTRAILVGTDGSERIEQAWSWDPFGNVAATWKGAESPEAGVELYRYRYTDPANPTESFITDPLGNESSFNFERDPDSNKALLTHSTASCSSCGTAPDTQQFRDDPRNPLRVTRSVDARGVETRTAYDEHGQVISRTEAYGTALARTTTWEYDPDNPGLVLATEQPSTSGSGVRRTSWIYDTRGRPTARTIEGIENGAPFSYTTETVYNGPGMVLGLNPPGHGYRDMTIFEYDPERGNLVMVSREDPLVGTTFFVHDGFNRQVRVTDPNGLVTETVYDDLDRVLRVTQKGATTAEDLVTTYEYTPFGELHRTILPEGNVIEYGYDTRGRLISIERKPDRTTHGERTFYTLNDDGQRIREELQSWTGSGWQTEKWTGYVYSSGCNLDKILHADGTVTEYGYGCDGSLEKEWDANHPSNNQESPATKVYDYDELGRLNSVTQPWGGEGGGTLVVRYEYDVQDHLVKVVDGNGTVTTYEYSDRDLLTMDISEVTGVTTYAYDESGQVIRETDARDVTVKRQYDTLGRLRFVDYPEYDLDIMYDWDDKSVPFSKGRMTAIRRGGESVDYRYDRFGRMTQDGALTYACDKNSNRTTIGYPGGVTATYTHDYADREATLSFQENQQPQQRLVTSTSYKPFGPVGSLTFANGLSETRTYTNRYLPLNMEVSDRVSWSYETDALGDVTKITDHFDPTSTRVFRYQDYQYYLQGGIGPWGSLTWTYDKLGNRLTEIRDDVTSTYAYRANAAGFNSPQLKQVLKENENVPIRYFFDPAGNMTHSFGEDWKYKYNYNAASRLAGIVRDSVDTTPGVTELSYDGRDFLRDSTFLPALAITISHWSTRATYSSDGTLYHRSIQRHVTPSTPRDVSAIRGADYVFFLAARPIALLQKKVITRPGGAMTTISTLSFVSTDHLGSPLLLTDNSGKVRWKNTRDPFSASVSEGPDAIYVLTFPGQWIDETWADSSEDTLRAPLHYNLKRWYHPGLARFTRPDPLGLLPPGRSASNPYIYAINNPVINYDPWGLDAITDDQGIQDCIYCIYYKAGYGHYNTEEALWVICDKNKLSCEIWPSTANQGTSVKSNTSFKGKIPKNACALIHTHPRQKPAEPSACPGCDTDVARGLNMPIYTAHPTGIWKFDPNTGQVTNEAGKKWHKPIKKQCKKPCQGLP